MQYLRMKHYFWQEWNIYNTPQNLKWKRFELTLFLKKSKLKGPPQESEVGNVFSSSLLGRTGSNFDSHLTFELNSQKYPVVISRFVSIRFVFYYYYFISILFYFSSNNWPQFLKGEKNKKSDLYREIDEGYNYTVI